MSNIFGILNTAVSGLYASQMGIEVTGHNIANMNTEGYSRQRVNLATEAPMNVTPGNVGLGVNIQSITRIYDSVLGQTLRSETSSLNYWESMQTSLDSVGVYFNELELGSGLGDSLQEYFDAWHDLANTAPDNSAESIVKRQALVEKSVSLATKITDSYEALESLRSNSDSKISEYVKEINDIAENIALLNTQISKVEANGNNANDLRDLREGLLDDLSAITGMTSYERPDGEIAVYISGAPIVDGQIANQLYAIENPDNDNHLEIYWGSDATGTAEMNITDKIAGGNLLAEVELRDTLISGYQDDLNSLASGLITETNRLHSVGQGLDRFTSMTSNSGVINPSYEFSTEPGALPTQVNEGVMRISVFNSEGIKVQDYDIDIDPETDSMNSVIAKINLADVGVTDGNISAFIAQDNSVKISTENGYTFSFTEDTSNFLVAAGLNSYFNGTDASNIELNDTVLDHPSYIATGKSGESGDNTNASDIAQLAYASVYDSPDVSFSEFYTIFAAKIGSDKNKVDVFVSTRQETVNQLTLRLESNRGVSEDEEFTNLIKFQSAYEASARILTAVDEMLDTLINGTGRVGR